MAFRAFALIAAATAALTLEVGDASKSVEEVISLSKRGLAAVSDANFDRLVRAAHRPYHTFVLFNAKEPQYQCALCGPFEDEIEVLAASYWRQRNAQVSPSEVPLIVFARAEIGQNRKTFAEYSLQQAPILVYFPPTDDTPHPKTKFPPNSQYASELDAENAAGFVRERTEYRIEVYRSPWGRIAVSVVGLLGLAVSIYMSAEHVLHFYESIRAYTALWVLAGVGVYFIAVSGILYDIIRGVPPFGFDSRTRRVMFVAQQAGTQYVAEGLIVGGLNIAAALAALMLVRVLPKVRNTETRNAGAIVAGLAFLFFYYQIYALYCYKNPWYSLSNLVTGQGR